MYTLGYDSGTSSIKASLLNVDTGQVVASAFAPAAEMPIDSPCPSWAQQSPELWWQNLILATHQLLNSTQVSPAEIKAIGISYQMHGLVCVDKDLQTIRPSIIWCDSRAVEIGNIAADSLGHNHCLQHLLNYPGNFTASKLRWLIENEPHNFDRIKYIMLPGDWLAMKMTGLPATTQSGLSEMTLWDFPNAAPAGFLMDFFDFSADLIPEIVPTFGHQGKLTTEAASVLGLAPNTPVTYRAGDQPNNAMSLNVLEPGEIAATAGTSGVIYGISDSNLADPHSRVNVFLHVNNTPGTTRNGVLLCVNGTGRLNSWLRNTLTPSMSYSEMNSLADSAPIGSDGLTFLPYGNGSERTLANNNIAASLHNLELNTHNLAHILRAGQEGIVFALNYGLDIMRTMNISANTIKAGRANMFLSPIFANTFAALTGATIELYDTDGSQGAARAAALGANLYTSRHDAFCSLTKLTEIHPNTLNQQAVQSAYQNWRNTLNSIIS